ncbi:MAG: hypothetical protein CL927_06305 [Deltaproteobacteria bacterium]|nr:hypothetical protein [Deltaproteobacteria bacterium]
MSDLSAPLTVRDLEYRPHLKALNAGVGLLHGLGVLPQRITPEHVKQAAMKRTGLSDFGDSSYEAPYQKLLEVLPNHPLSSLGTLLTEQTMVKAMSNRLRIQDHLNRHPALASARVERPVFVLGFPRTGTTLLQNLLGLDEGQRSLQFWEIQTPIPLDPDPRRDHRKRFNIAKRTLQLAYLVAPEQRQIHEIKPETPEECWPLFSNSFAVLNYDLLSMFADYGRWLLDYDMTGPYAFYRDTLKVLGQGRPAGERYLLKCPEHLWFIDALLAVFPDARIVWTHRDPVASVASYCSLISLGQRMLYGTIDPARLGAHIQDRFHMGVQRAMAARDASGREDQFFDVDFKDLVRDPAAVVREVKAWADMPHDKAGQARVERYLSTERGDKKGAHKYSAEVYGLDGQAIHREYADYIERFRIPLKPIS